MAELVLNVPIDVKVSVDGEVTETLRVTYRYPTKKEEKELAKLQEHIKELAKKGRKLEREKENLNRRLRYAEERGEYEKAEKLLSKLEKVENELDAIMDEFERYGGDNYPEEIAKKKFDLFVGGEGAEKLREYAERVGYGMVVALLEMERNELEKKRLGV